MIQYQIVGTNIIRIVWHAHLQDYNNMLKLSIISTKILTIIIVINKNC